MSKKIYRREAIKCLMQFTFLAAEWNSTPDSTFSDSFCGFSLCNFGYFLIKSSAAACRSIGWLSFCATGSLESIQNGANWWNWLQNGRVSFETNFHSKGDRLDRQSVAIGWTVLQKSSVRTQLYSCCIIAYESSVRWRAFDINLSTSICHSGVLYLTL